MLLLSLVVEEVVLLVLALEPQVVNENSVKMARKKQNKNSAVGIPVLNIVLHNFLNMLLFILTEYSC